MSLIEPPAKSKCENRVRPARALARGIRRLRDFSNRLLLAEAASPGPNLVWPASGSVAPFFFFLFLCALCGKRWQAESRKTT